MSNEMFSSAKRAFKFTRRGICERRRDSRAVLSTMNSCDNGLGELRENRAELFGFDYAVETRRDERGRSGQMSRRSRASTVENKTCGGLDISDRIRIIGKVVD